MMKKIYVLFLVLIFSCQKEPSQDIFYLKQSYSQDYSNSTGLEQLEGPFSKMEFKKDSVWIDGIAKKFEKKGSRLLIYGDDLEADFEIKTWSKDEIYLSQRDGSGKELFLLFKK